METQRSHKMRKSPRYDPPEPIGYDYRSTPNLRAVMSMNIWTGEFGINEYYDLETFKKKYPFAEDTLEVDAEAIITHETIHQTLRKIVGLKAAYKFDDIVEYHLMRFYVNPI